MSGYDSHFLIKEIASNEILKGRTRVIAQNSERYISFTKYVTGTRLSFRFIDSFRFMPSSLEKLASYLNDFKIVDEEFEKDGYTDTATLKQKGVFPYEYVTNLDKLQEKNLPGISHFFSKLTNSGIGIEEYEHAQKVWDMYVGGGTLGDYSDIYLKTDVLLLADVFESFRETCIKAYGGLDPAHYYTSPGLSWDAMLKHTNINLHLLTDIDMLLFVERGKNFFFFKILKKIKYIYFYFFLQEFAVGLANVQTDTPRLTTYLWVKIITPTRRINT